MRFRTAIPAVLLFCGFSALPRFSGALQRILRRRGQSDSRPGRTPTRTDRTEWTFARLRYPSGRYSGYDGERGSWPTDFPKADRQFLQGVRRLTRIHTLLHLEQVIEPHQRPQRTLQLALELRGRGRPLGPHRRTVQTPSRVLPARWFPHGRRLPRHLRMGCLPRRA